MEPWEKNLDPVQRDFLEHPRRREIVELLAKRPGLNKSQIARELATPLNNVRFHLDRREAVDLVEMRKSLRGGEKVCFLPCSLHLWEDTRTRVLYGGSRVREMAIEVVDTPGISAAELGRRLGLSSGAVHHHIVTLLEHGLVHRFRLGRGYRYYPTAALEQWRERTPG